MQENLENKIVFWEVTGFNEWGAHRRVFNSKENAQTHIKELIENSDENITISFYKVTKEEEEV